MEILFFYKSRGGNIVEGCCIVLTRDYKIAVMDLSPPFKKNKTVVVSEFSGMLAIT